MSLQAHAIYISYHLRDKPAYDSAASAFAVQNPKRNFANLRPGKHRIFALYEMLLLFYILLFFTLVLIQLLMIQI